MTHPYRRIALATAVAAIGLPSTLYAREAHLVAGNTSAWVEIQGANGPILAPSSTFTYPYLPYGTTLDGIATDGTSGYFLVTTSNFATSTTSDAIWTYNLATGVRTATTPIQRPTGDPGPSDIALLNGTLYVASGPTSPTPNGTTRVYSVGPVGTLTNVYSRTDATAATPQIAASSQSNRVVLLPVAGPNYSPFTNTPKILINPSTWSATEAVSGTSAGQISFNLDGSRLNTYMGSGSLSFIDAYAVPGFTKVSSTGATFGLAGPTIGSAISDAFDYAYSSTSPAVVKLYEQQHTFLPLFRSGQHIWQGSTKIGNYAAPDATTVNQVAATGLTWSQTAGPTVQTSTTLSPAGNLALNGIVAETTFTVDASGVSRDVYTLQGTATLRGRYAAPGIDETRPLSVVNTVLSAAFAIDPVSSNYVGNGDLELGSYGWTGVGAMRNHYTSSQALGFTPVRNSPENMSQTLELGTPHGPMVLAFDYTPDSTSATVDLSVTVDGTNVAFLPGITGSTGQQHFSVILSDPQLQGLINPVLNFRAAISNGIVARVFVDNISLTAIPEPSALALVALASLPVLRRR